MNAPYLGSQRIVPIRHRQVVALVAVAGLLVAVSWLVFHPDPPWRDSGAVLRLTPRYPTVKGRGCLMASGAPRQDYTIITLDCLAFTNGGRLTLDIQLGKGLSLGSFFLFPAEAVLPTVGRPRENVAGVYDLGRPIQKGLLVRLLPSAITRIFPQRLKRPQKEMRASMTHEFQAGQIFHFTASGSWSSPEGSTNTFVFRATVDSE